ncbi:MAG: NAD-dependent epimerase/dehydratase family protein [Candidatus Micrarchaeota archaeon]
MKVAVTGGAGFIGSHLVDKLIEEKNTVTVIDNLCAGKQEHVDTKATFIKKDIRQNLSNEFKDIEAVFHFAADPEVRSSATAPTNGFDINVVGTMSVLEACRTSKVKHIILASTSTVYGYSETIPTPEDNMCSPISNYGASKLACEAYFSSYSSSYGIKSTCLRFANIFGERSTHGVMFDFYNKLKKNPNELEILGDGKQDKSYLHVSDCVSAILTAFKKQKKTSDVYNVGSQEKTTVNHLAKLVCNNLGIDPLFKYTGSKQGWVGDVPLMLLDVSKLEKLGWKQKLNFADGVKQYVNWLRNH